MIKSKPKHGEYKCSCGAHIDGNFSPKDTVFCYLCGKQMKVKDMVKVEKPKEFKSPIKPDLYALDPLSYEFHLDWTEKYGHYTIIDGHGRIRTDLMGV